MANTVLVRQFHEYQSLGVAPSTRRTYQAGVKQQFCKQYNVPDFPSTSLTLRYFCTWLIALSGLHTYAVHSYMYFSYLCYTIYRYCYNLLELLPLLLTLLTAMAKFGGKLGAVKTA